MKLEHIGVYLDSLKALPEMSAFFGGSMVEEWQNPEAALAVQVHDFSGVKVEFLEQPGRHELGIDHIAFSTSQFDHTQKRLLSAGAVQERVLTLETGKRILFVLWNNMRVEIMEK